MLKIVFKRAATTELELRFDFPVKLEPTIEQERLEQGDSTHTFEYAYYLADAQSVWQMHTIWQMYSALVEGNAAIRQAGYTKGLG